MAAVGTISSVAAAALFIYTVVQTLVNARTSKRLSMYADKSPLLVPAGKRIVQ